MIITAKRYLLFLAIIVNVYAGKLDGLELQFKSTIAVIPYGEKVIIYPTDDGEICTGSLINVSDTKIYIKDIQTGDAVIIRKNKVEQIRAKAKTRLGKNFSYGATIGSAVGTCIGLFETARQYQQTNEPATIIFGGMIFTPLASITGGLSFGIINLLNKIDQVGKTDVFFVGKDNWQFAKIRKSPKGLFKKVFRFSPGLK